MVIIKKGRENIIYQKHPWIYSGAILKIDGNHKNGEIIPVADTNREILCWGYYSHDSSIAVRTISYGPDSPDENWIKKRIKNAIKYRESLCIPSNAFRLINAEGDFIPGLVVDIYNTTTVVRPLIKGIELGLDKIINELKVFRPENKIIIKKDEYTARKENIKTPNGYIIGTGEGIEIIEENNINFCVDILKGQKTGFYLDQRDNRILFSTFCKDKSVLDLFSYHGAFSLAAAKGGAKKSVSVESSKTAIDFSKNNVQYNKDISTCDFTWIQDNVFDIIDDIDCFDVIVLDPPPFARRKREVDGAIKGYRHLVEKATLKLNKNGYIFIFSCSGALTREKFLSIMHEAILKSSRKIRIVKEMHAPGDHPFSVFHPEGEYLKGWILYAE